MKKVFLLIPILLWWLTNSAYATTDDRDGDGYSNDAEIQIYGTDPDSSLSYPGAPTPDYTKLAGKKRIEIDLSEQKLRYYKGEVLVGSTNVSTGIAKMPTPKGTFVIRSKIPVKSYAGRGYYYPNTKWNMGFLSGYYIHGAYWHNNFGRPMSHGCINVSYADMPELYAFADVGTRITIHR